MIDPLNKPRRAFRRSIERPRKAGETARSRSPAWPSAVAGPTPKPRVARPALQPTGFVLDTRSLVLSDDQKQQLRNAFGNKTFPDDNWRAFLAGMKVEISGALAYRDAHKGGTKQSQSKQLHRILSHLDAVLKELRDDKLSAWAKWNVIEMGLIYEFDEAYLEIEPLGVKAYRPVERMRRRKTSLSQKWLRKCEQRYKWKLWV